MIKTKREINLMGNSSSKTQLRLEKIKKAQCLLDWKFGPPPGRELIISINVFCSALFLLLQYSSKEIIGKIILSSFLNNV